MAEREAVSQNSRSLASIGGFMLFPPPQPRFRDSPFPFHCPRRNIQHLADFFVSQAAEEAEFNDLTLARIQREKILQGIVERDQIDAPLRGRRERFVEGKLVPSASAFFRAMGPSIVHENAPHDLGGHTEKMGAVLPRGGALIDEAQISFMDEAGRLQGVVRAFSLQILAGELAQFFVDERHEASRCLAVASAPIDKHASHVCACRG